MSKFLLEIITPQRRAFAEEVERVTVPTTNGIIGVLPHHEPLFCSLTEGEIKIDSAGKEFFLAIGGGFMEITPKRVSILVSRAVNADELNESEIKAATESAKKAIAQSAKGVERASAQAMLRRSLIELKVFGRKNKRSTINPTR
jgi:F-type H+-transporting ATPase subunit epsilon